MQQSHSGIPVHATREVLQARVTWPLYQSTGFEETGDQPHQCNKDLSEARRRVRWYLAIEFLADVMVLGTSPLRHVLGY